MRKVLYTFYVPFQSLLLLHVQILYAVYIFSQAKKVNLYERYVILLGILNLLLQVNILHRCYHHNFFMKSSVNIEISAHLYPLSGNFLHIAYPYKLFTSKYCKYTVFLVLS